MDLGHIGLDGMDWIDLTQDRVQWRALVNTVMDLRMSAVMKGACVYSVITAARTMTETSFRSFIMFLLLMGYM
jgi:hypothetical protein